MGHLSVLLCYLIKTSMLAEFAVYLYEYDVSEKDLRVLFQLNNVVYCDRQEGIFQFIFSNTFLQYVLVVWLFLMYDSYFQLLHWQ